MGVRSSRAVVVTLKAASKTRRCSGTWVTGVAPTPRITGG